MLNILVVDDEPRQRKGLVRLLQSMRPDYMILEAKDGQAAIELIQSIEVQIILTDIAMPNVDGMELLKYIQQNKPEIKTVVLSVYSQFEYAKTALETRAFGYILKPIDPTEIESMLVSLESLIENEHEHSAEQQSMREKLNETMQVYINHLFNLLLKAQPSSTVANELTDIFPLTQGGLIMLYRFDGFSLTDKSTENQEILLNIKYWIKSELNSYGSCISFILEKEDPELVTILLSNRTPEEKIFKVISDKFTNEYQISTIVSVSNIHNNILSNIKLAFDEALTAIQFSFYGNCINYYKDLSYDPYQLVSNRYDEEDQLAQSLAAGNLKEVESLLYDLINNIINSEHPLPNSLKQQVFQILIGQMKRVDGFLPIETKKKLVELLNQIINNCPTLEHLQMQAAEIFKRISEEIQQRKSDLNSKLVNDCMRYIKNHYMDNLSLDSISEMFHFNPSYFSTLFKTISGVNFSEYLLEVRMKTARDLLTNRNDKITSIASLVGYKDSSYFARVFKQYSGFAPEEYRKIHTILLGHSEGSS